MSSDAVTESQRIDSEGEPVERTSAALIQLALQMKASDLFVLTNENSVEIQLRQLGLMRPVREYSLDYGRRLISHFKAVSGMDIAERFRPTEGRWVFPRDNGPPVDIRLNTIPTLFGEDLTCRLLDRQRGLRPLEELHLGDRATWDLQSLLKHPSGLILVTGPTGSGKTTSLYACLQSLNDGQRKINTLEDPIEYTLPGIRQSQVNSRLGTDFSVLLPACLRQAPDIIMIGEIRDSKTANIAVRAANSGHLVLATLHAPVAAAAPFALIAYGVSPHFLTSSLLGIISQRLLRRLCVGCRVPIDLTGYAAMFEDVRALLPDGGGDRMYSPGRCDACFQQGYDELICVCEIMTMNDRLRCLVIAEQPLQQLHAAAVQDGMVELRRAALVRIAMGETTTEEMFRQVPFEYFGEPHQREPGGPPLT